MFPMIQSAVNLNNTVRNTTYTATTTNDNNNNDSINDLI